MIILSVIVVGAAIAVGVQMFDNSAKNLARDAIIGDMIRMGAEAQAWYRAPRMMGGGDNSMDFSASNIANPDLKIAKYLDDGAEDLVISNANGTYTLTLDGLVLTINAQGRGANENIRSTATIELNRGHDGIEVDRVPVMTP
jgi:hypothetical protein